MQPVQRSFSSGELSPSLRQRADLTRYSTGLHTCENFLVKAEGGIASRPGTRYVGPLDDHTRRGRLIPFSFNTEQTYILVFEHLKMRVVMDGGFVIDGAGPALYEIATPYTEDQLPRLIYIQDADVMTITHIAHPPKALTRIDHDNWTLTDVDFDSAVAAPGALTITQVGAGGGGSNTKAYRYIVTAIDSEGVESLPSPEGTSGVVASLSTTYGNKLDWADVTGAVQYRIYKDPSDGSGVYGWIGDSINSEYVDYNVAPVVSDAPPSDYLPFDGANYPATVGYYQQRQMYANSFTEPMTVWGTQSANYVSMRSSSPPRDDDALEFTLKARKVTEVRHIIDLDALIILTSGAEWIVTDGQDMVLTPSTLGFRARSYFGASWCAPAMTGDAAVYVVEKGSRIRDIHADGTGLDLSITARHLFDTNSPDYNYVIEEMAYAAEPYGIVWMVRNDGILLGLTYLPDHEVFAWHRHTTGEIDMFESVASISEDGRDAVYVIVLRERGGQWYRSVERIEPRYTDSAVNAFFVDCGLSYNGVPNDTISGLAHLEGKAVAVLADGNEVQGMVVTGGSITLPAEASVVHVGLPYIPRAQTLDLDFTSEQTVNAGMKSVSLVVLNVLDSRGGWIAPVENDEVIQDFVEIPPRLESDGYDSIALRTGKIDVILYDGWNKSGAIRIEQRSPLPMEILSIVPQTDVSI